MTNQVESLFEPTLLRRRSSLFKPSVQDDELLREAINEFITTHTKCDLSVPNVPIIWERLASGYRIVDFEIERTAEAFSLLKNYYFYCDNSSLTSSLYIDGNTLKKYQQYIFHILSNYNSFCVIEEGTSKIIAIALAKVNFVTDTVATRNQILSVKDAFDVIEYEKSILNEVNIFENYKVDQYFCIHLICVEPNHYGKGIATALIRSCLKKAQRIQYPVCVGIFPAGSCQTIAQRLGFETLSKKVWMMVKESRFGRRISYVNYNMLEKTFVTCMIIFLSTDDNTENKGNPDD